jgi:hypothetical protein
LLDEARPGRPRTIDDEQVAEVIDLILHPEKNLSSVRTIT